MNPLLARPCLAALLAMSMVAPLRAQKSSPPPHSPPVSSGPSTGTSRQPTGPVQPNSPVNPMPTPIRVSGRVLTDSDKPAGEAILVQLYCGMRLAQAVRTNLNGYFDFLLGGGLQGNSGYSADDEASVGLRNSGPTSGNSLSAANLSGCDVRVSVSGYQPLTYTISGHADMTGIQVGTMRLSRIGGVPGSSVSVTSLLVPDKARKEFEKGQKDGQNKNYKAAAEHLEKAVAEYDKYAAAWNALGAFYSGNQELEKSRQSFAKSIAANPKYVPPYMNLANLELQDGKDENAIQEAGQVLDLDPGNPFANFIQAMGNFNLRRLDSAEKSALAAEKGSNGGIPEVHVLLADIHLQKADDSAAMIEMRAYLREAPNGKYAAQITKLLERTEKASDDLGSSPRPSLQSPTAP
jgi:tetratricopeptide (TPR) repeat protein